MAMGLQVHKMSGVLIKLVVDMWIAGDPRETFALILAMLQAALKQPDAQYRIRVFDLLYNLSLHAHMLESDSGSQLTDSARSHTRSQTTALAPGLLRFGGASGRDSRGWTAFLPPEPAVRSLLCLHCLLGCVTLAPAGM